MIATKDVRELADRTPRQALAGVCVSIGLRLGKAPCPVLHGGQKPVYLLAELVSRLSHRRLPAEPGARAVRSPVWGAGEADWPPTAATTPDRAGTGPAAPVR